MVTTIQELKKLNDLYNEMGTIFDNTETSFTSSRDLFQYIQTCKGFENIELRDCVVIVNEIFKYLF